MVRPIPCNIPDIGIPTYDVLLRQAEEYNGKHQRACLEIERLRSALNEIADGDAYHDGARRFMEIARAALLGESHE